MWDFHLSAYQLVTFFKSSLTKVWKELTVNCPLCWHIVLLRTVAPMVSMNLIENALNIDVAANWRCSTRASKFQEEEQIVLFFILCYDPTWPDFFSRYTVILYTVHIGFLDLFSSRSISSRSWFFSGVFVSFRKPFPKFQPFSIFSIF